RAPQNCRCPRDTLQPEDRKKRLAGHLRGTHQLPTDPLSGQLQWPTRHPYRAWAALPPPRVPLIARLLIPPNRPDTSLAFSPLDSNVCQPPPFLLLGGFCQFLRSQRNNTSGN